MRSGLGAGCEVKAGGMQVVRSGLGAGCGVRSNGVRPIDSIAYVLTFDFCERFVFVFPLFGVTRELTFSRNTTKGSILTPFTLDKTKQCAHFRHITMLPFSQLKLVSGLYLNCVLLSFFVMKPQRKQKSLRKNKLKRNLSRL